MSRRSCSQEALAFVRRGELNRALAAEAVARARVDVAARGLDPNRGPELLRHRRGAAESTKWADLVARRRNVSRTSHSRKLEKGGEAAHSDVIRAQIDLQQRQRDLREAHTDHR